MNEKDTLLLRHLRRIQAHGYYHEIDVAVLDWFLSNRSVAEICAKYDVRPHTLYQQKSRLARQRQEVEV